MQVNNFERPRDLLGRQALVTGGGRGIGRAVVMELARRGADVLVNYFRNEATALETAEQARALGVRAEPIRGHIGDPERIDRMFGAIQASWGRLDILVNNAASGVIRPTLQLDVRHWDWTMNINARGAWLCARHAAALMDQGGAIVNISSLGSDRVLPDYSAVGISKAALEALTRYLAVELADRNIVVNAVSGGLVETDALEFFAGREAMLEAARERTPARRMLEPDDLARVVGFLCSRDAWMIRGQTIIVDGGYSLPS
ncbi:MAG: enoyl-[acyl-carrier-protein] reductase FabL [Chloroflexota bacterium]